ncbi:3-carboxy-cis,cis-muconate cycloisomerase [Streptomyces showdoensis]|uniref:3-carboxy-cis,cis-muconate cycloisomerase n=1 Tax=Streptomyces showdoensis TaxID=68268 RepID=A0A2P2GVC9_STREW|nr:3-carboxy-cis,cis-muconate cycloisomerase [Streptomyces showdoensis]KKZ75447.1 3-carboxy-cis,cis-muconate cycloisomerase [Streptomyces showdoensis]
MTDPTGPTAEPDLDAGLLDPVRAGSPAEAATGDAAFLRALLDAEAALTRAQAAVGAAPAEAARAVTEAAADTYRFDVRSIALRARGGGNPVIPLVADLTATAGEWGAYVHRGATSQDILDTAAMLVAARTLGAVLADLARTESALAGLAAAHRDTAMPGRTLTQHAVPTTFGLKAAGWRSLVLDARDRLLAVRDGLPAQLGGAAGTLAAFADACAAIDAIDADADSGAEGAAALPAAYARELGLAVPLIPWHTLRTPVADLAGALALTAGALGKIATDVLTLSRTEIAELAEGTGGGSSAMPHKANPVRAILVASAARRSPHLAASLYACLPAEDERPAGAWHAEWEPLRELLRLTGGAAHHTAALAEGLRVDAAAMRAHLDVTGGLLVSERLSVVLAPLLGRARARALLTELAARTRAEGRGLAELLAEAAAGVPELAGVDLAELTDPTRATGLAGHLTDRALERR